MKTSAGILLYKTFPDKETRYFLVHPGGPFWKNKDAGAWSIPKGEVQAGEDALMRATTEFREETGQPITGPFLPLTPIRQKGGKTVYAWATEGEVDMDSLHSNTFTLEWPPRSGKFISVPEVDQWRWFTLEEAIIRINPAQKALLHELHGLLQNRLY